MSRERKRSSVGLLLLLLATAYFPRPALASPWDTAHFPNVTLTTQNGEQVRFFDDLIKGKVVVINFIFTSCVDTCPLETAHLVQVAEILGHRVGHDVFFYSITIDPDVDTPAVLRKYAQRYGADWTFLTGSNVDITRLRRKLGLYIEEIQDGSNNHNVSMIIGNEATGQWRKSSPFENAYVAADKIGRWLTGWKQPTVGGDYRDVGCDHRHAGELRLRAHRDARIDHHGPWRKDAKNRLIDHPTWQQRRVRTGG